VEPTPLGWANYWRSVPRNVRHASASKLSVPPSRLVVSRTRTAPLLLAVSTHDPFWPLNDDLRQSIGFPPS
jgi:hypothetical protein